MNLVLIAALAVAVPSEIVTPTDVATSYVLAEDKPGWLARMIEGARDFCENRPACSVEVIAQESVVSPDGSAQPIRNGDHYSDAAIAGLLFQYLQSDGRELARVNCGVFADPVITMRGFSEAGLEARCMSSGAFLKMRLTLEEAEQLDREREAVGLPPL